MMGMDGADLQASREQSPPSVAMEGVCAVVEMAGGGHQLVIAHQILIAQRHLRCHHALVKRRGMEGADLHEDCLEEMVGAGLLLAHQWFAQTVVMEGRFAKSTEVFV